MLACKQQNHGSMQAAEPWTHASSRTTVAYASIRTIVACKQQNYGSMQAAELKQQNYGCMQAAEQWIVAA